MKKNPPQTPLAKRLAAAIGEMKAIERGDLAPGRVTQVEATGKARRLSDPAARVVQARARLGLTQEDFARLLGISVATLRNWEQGRRLPEKTARVLIAVVERAPELVLQAARAA